MKRLHPSLFVLLFLLLLGCFDFKTTAQKSALSKHPYESERPMPEPTIFGEGVISTGDYESHPAFTPDGRTLYFLKNTPSFSFWTIVVSNWKAGRWSEPVVAPFSGQYSDADPFITPDGSKLFFISNRPVDGKPKDDLDIWMLEKTASGWSAPMNPGAPVNSSGNEWYPTMAANGTLYFGSDREGGKGRTDLYRSRLVNGKYTEPENLGDVINTQFNEFEPYIAPDESFLIFMGGRTGSLGSTDLWITYRRDNTWTKPANLGDKINSKGTEYSPKISPDGKYFFWTSTRGFADEPLAKPLTYQELSRKLRSTHNGLGDIYQIDLSALKIER